MQLRAETTVSRANEIFYSRVGNEEAVMLSVTAGAYYGLNAVALRIWELLDQPKTIAELCEHLCEEFEIDASTCQSEVLTFVNELIDNRIVHAAAT
jgi:hypothetical protein